MVSVSFFRLTTEVAAWVRSARQCTAGWPFAASRSHSRSLVYGEYPRCSSFFNPINYGLTHKVAIASARAGNVIGGGKHAKNSCDIQEFLLLPTASSFKEAVNANRLAHEITGRILNSKQDQESAWTRKAGTDQILELLKDVTEQVEKKTGEACILWFSNLLKY